MKRTSAHSLGLTLTELMMVSFVLSIVMVCIFRALTMFTQGALKIQRDLPAQRALQAASAMLTADLLASPRSTINNLLPNPGFEDFAGGLSISVTPTTGTWSSVPFRMGPNSNSGFYFPRIQSALNPYGSQCLAIYTNWALSSVVSPAVGPAEKTEPYLFAGFFRTTDINSDAQGTVRGGFNPLAPATSLGTLKNAGNWTVRAASFSATMGHYHQVTLFINPSINIGAFDNIYLGPFSVEISTSHLSGQLFMKRANAEGERERVEYSMSVGARGVGRLVRKLTQTSGVEKISSIDGIDSLKVSWVGAPSPTGGTNRPLLIELTGRGETANPAAMMSISFEVYPRVP